MSIQAAIALLVEQQDLDDAQMSACMQQIMTGAATPAQIGSFLTALRMKGESVTEIAAAARVMRNLADRVHSQNSDIVDLVGTGGDSQSTFNISTASAIVAAAAGAPVAKHGNRSVSSKSGAADLLEQAGVNLELNAEQVARCIDEIGIGFMFATRHHSAMKHAIGPRREMAIRTLFNILGPLTNPAHAKRQLIGVFSAHLVAPLAEVLGRLGSIRALVVHADIGLDEISISGGTDYALWDAGQLHRGRITPEEYGLTCAPLSEIQVENSAQSLAVIQQVLQGTAGAARDIVLLNAGAGLFAAGTASTIKDGIHKAAQAIDNGSAQNKLAELVNLTQSMRVLA